MSAPQPLSAPEQQVQEAFRVFRCDDALAGATAGHAQALAASNHALAADMAMVAANVHANQGRHAQALVWAERAAASANATAAETGGSECQAPPVAARMHRRAGHRLAPRLSVTVSAGLTEVLPGESFNAAVARADALLYRAKREGRNRVVWAPAR